LLAFHEVPIEYIREKWNTLGEAERLAVLALQKCAPGFYKEVWDSLSERETNAVCEVADITADFVAEYWPRLTEDQKNALRWRDKIKEMSKDHLPALIVDPDSEVRQVAKDRMEGE